MLQEAIYKFKTSGPVILPDLIDNVFLSKVTSYEDYAILLYDLPKPQSMENVLEIYGHRHAYS